MIMCGDDPGWGDGQGVRDRITARVQRVTAEERKQEVRLALRAAGVFCA